MRLGLRIWILIIALILALLSIAPWKALENGVLIRSIEVNSTEFNQGLRQGQIINTIDGKEVKNLQDFSDIINKKNRQI